MPSKASRTAILGSVSIAVLALAGGGVWGVKHQVATMIAGVPGLKVGAWSIDPASMQLKISHINLAQPGMTLAADAVTIPMSLGNLWAMASARAAGGEASADQVVITTPELSLNIPHISATNASFDSAALAKMLDPKDPMPLAQRLAAFSAGSISIPAMSMTQQIATTHSVANYHDIALTGVDHGVIAHATLGKIDDTFDSKTPKAASVHGTATLDSLSIDQLSLPVYLHWMLDPRQNNQETRQLALGDEKFNGVAVHVVVPTPKIQVSWDITVKSGEATNMLLRSMAVPMIKFAAALPHPTPGKPADPQQVSKILAMEGDLLSSASLDRLTAQDIVVTTTPSPSTAPTPMKPVTVTLAGFNLAETAVPTAPPSAYALNLDHLKIDLDQFPDNPDLTKFKTNFYHQLDLSFSQAMSWDLAKGIIELKDLTLSGVGAGAATLGLKVTDIGPTLLGGSMEAAEAALLPAKATALHLHIDNQGVVQKYLSAEAAASSETPQQFTQQLVAGTGTMIPAVLGSSTGSTAIAAALAKFLGDPKNIDITATSPQGIGAPDVMAAKMAGPAALMSKVAIKASANQ